MAKKIAIYMFSRNVLFEKEPYKELQGVSTLNKINCGSEVKGPASTLVGMPW
jgi:hypothetical protein